MGGDRPEDRDIAVVGFCYRNLPAGDLAPGQLQGDVVVTGAGGLRLVTVQPEGRSPMAVRDWLRGARPRPEEGLGS